MRRRLVLRYRLLSLVPPVDLALGSSPSPLPPLSSLPPTFPLLLLDQLRPHPANSPTPIRLRHSFFLLSFEGGLSAPSLATAFLVPLPFFAGTQLLHLLFRLCLLSISS